MTLSNAVKNSFCAKPHYVEQTRGLMANLVNRALQAALNSTCRKQPSVFPGSRKRTMRIHRGLGLQREGGPCLCAARPPHPLSLRLSLLPQLGKESPSAHTSQGALPLKD